MKLAPLEDLILRLFQFLNGDRACLDILLCDILDESKNVRKCLLIFGNVEQFSSNF